MGSYYRTIWEGFGGPDTEEGYYYAEIEGGEIVRQIVVIGDGLYWATLYECNNELYTFTDQPEVSEEELEALEEVSTSEFEELWTKAKQVMCR